MPGIFICYRQSDSLQNAAWLRSLLEPHFGDECVFRDRDSIAPGDDPVQAIERQMSLCDVLLVLIGSAGLNAVDEKGRLPLDDARDPVRMEIELALRRHLKIIPVLLSGAQMPHYRDLPPSMQQLAYRYEPHELSDIAVQLAPLVWKLKDVVEPNRSIALPGIGPIPAGKSSRVWFSGTATRQEAEALAKEIEGAGWLYDPFFGGSDFDVLLSKTEQCTTISYTLPGEWFALQDDPSSRLLPTDGIFRSSSVVIALDQITRFIADAAGGFPLKILLLDRAQNLRKEMTFHPTVNEIAYFGDITEAEARAFAEALDLYERQDEERSATVNLGARVHLDRRGGATVVSYVNRCNEGDVYWLEWITRTIADTIGGLPVFMRVLDDALEPEHERMLHSPMTIGTNDTLLYSGLATSAEARALGQRLQQIGYFRDRGFIVHLHKDNERTAVSFVSHRDRWDAKISVDVFEHRLGRQCADVVGGPPIHIQLLAGSLEPLERTVMHPPLTIDGVTVIYYDLATAEDATAVAQIVRNAVRGNTDVYLHRGKKLDVFVRTATTTLSFLLSGKWHDQPTIDKAVKDFAAIGHQAAIAMDEYPIDVFLADRQGEPHVAIRLERNGTHTCKPL